MTPWNTRTKKYIAALKDANTICKLQSGPTFSDHFISLQRPAAVSLSCPMHQNPHHFARVMNLKVRPGSEYWAYFSYREISLIFGPKADILFVNAIGASM